MRQLARTQHHDWQAPSKCFDLSQRYSAGGRGTVYHPAYVLSLRLKATRHAAKT